MLRNEKILITGATSTVARPFARALARDNEVWGVSRFTDPAAAERLQGLGVKTLALDLSASDLSALPTDFSYVLHLAYFRGGTAAFDQAMTVNGEGTGFLLHHCRRAKAALVMSSNGIYSPHEDPWHAPKEDAEFGGVNPIWSPTSVIAKIAEEAVGRYCARAFNLPVTIARLNTPYGPEGRLLPIIHMDSVVAGKEIIARWDPNPYTPIHTDDLCDQLEAMLDAASVPATIVNWAGDEHVSLQQWCEQAAALAGTHAKIIVKSAAPGVSRGSCADSTKRKAITGPCRTLFSEGYQKIYESRYERKAAL